MRRRVAYALTALTVWAAGSALGSVGPVPRASAQAPPIEIGPAHAGFTPALDGSKPIFILVLGSGARPPQPFDRGLADSIHVIGINLAKKRVTILGIPRDSWVEIPGHGMNKINAAMADGGPALEVQTVEQLTGIHLDYYVVTSFDGVVNAYKAIGGLTIDVPFPMHDSFSKADFNPGVQRLSGHDVLAFARDRHSLSSGDFGRSEDTGRVLIASLVQLHKEFQKDPGVLFTFISAAMQNLKTSLTLPQVLDLAFTALSIDPKHVTNVVLPGSTGMAGNLSIVNLSPSAKALYSDLAADAILSKKSQRLAPSPTLLQPGCCK